MSADDSQDLVQNVYLKALQNSPRQSESRRSWLAQVLRRQAFQDLQRNKNRCQIESGSNDNSDKSPKSPAEIMERLTIQRDLVNALLTISEGQRNVLILRFYEDLPPREIAKRCQLPLATVKSRQQRGLEELRKRLRNQYGDDPSWCTALAPLAGLAWPASSAAATWGLTQAGWLKSIVAAMILVATAAWLILEFAHDQPLELNTFAATENIDQVAPEEVMPRRSLQSFKPAETVKKTVIDDEDFAAAVAARRQQNPADKPAELSIQVFDSEGNVVPNVAVALEARLLDRKRRLWTAKSDESGMLDIDDAFDEFIDRNTCEELRALFAFPILDAPSVNLPRDLPSPSILSLTLPATGAVEKSQSSMNSATPS